MQNTVGEGEKRKDVGWEVVWSINFKKMNQDILCVKTVKLEGVL